MNTPKNEELRQLAFEYGLIDSTEDPSSTDITPTEAKDTKKTTFKSSIKLRD